MTPATRATGLNTAPQPCSRAPMRLHMQPCPAAPSSSAIVTSSCCATQIMMSCRCALASHRRYRSFIYVVIKRWGKGQDASKCELPKQQALMATLSTHGERREPRLWPHLPSPPDTPSSMGCPPLQARAQCPHSCRHEAPRQHSATRPAGAVAASGSAAAAAAARSGSRGQPTSAETYTYRRSFVVMGQRRNESSRVQEDWGLHSLHGAHLRVLFTLMLNRRLLVTTGRPFGTPRCKPCRSTARPAACKGWAAGSA